MEGQSDRQEVSGRDHEHKSIVSIGPSRDRLPSSNVRALPGDVVDVELIEKIWPRKEFPIPVTQRGESTSDLTRIEIVEAKSKVHTIETVKGTQQTVSI